MDHTHQTEFRQILVDRNNALKILNEDFKVRSEMVCSLEKVKKPLEEQIKDKNFVKMRMRCGESIEETTKKGDCICNGKHDGEQVSELNAIREELESKRE